MVSDNQLLIPDNYQLSISTIHFNYQLLTLDLSRFVSYNLRLLNPSGWASLERNGPIAQLVEQMAFNHWVAGSSPARLTIYFNSLGRRWESPFSILCAYCVWNPVAQVPKHHLFNFLSCGFLHCGQNMDVSIWS